MADFTELGVRFSTPGELRETLEAMLAEHGRNNVIRTGLDCIRSLGIDDACAVEVSQYLTETCAGVDRQARRLVEPREPRPQDYALAGVLVGFALCVIKATGMGLGDE